MTLTTAVDPNATPVATALDPAPGAAADVNAEVTEELLIEEISIDGMCGVY